MYFDAKSVFHSYCLHIGMLASFSYRQKKKTNKSISQYISKVFVYFFSQWILCRDLHTIINYRSLLFCLMVELASFPLHLFHPHPPHPLLWLEDDIVCKQTLWSLTETPLLVPLSWRPACRRPCRTADDHTCSLFW